MKRSVWFVWVGIALLFAPGYVQSAGDSLTVETSQRVYAAGQPVDISLVNETRHDVWSGLGYSITRADGGAVYVTMWPMLMESFPPGGALHYVWNQTYSGSAFGPDGGQVAPGVYVIHGPGADARAIAIR